MVSRIDYDTICKAKDGDQSALEAILVGYSEMITATAEKLADLLHLSKEKSHVEYFERIIKQELLVKVIYEKELRANMSPKCRKHYENEKCRKGENL